MRISTAQFYNQSVQTLDNHQSQLNQQYQQISSGQGLQTPADNPLGAAHAVQLTSTSAALSQYSTNQTAALSALQLEDKTLSSVTGVMQSVGSLIVRAGDGTLEDSDRAAIAKTLQGYRDQLLTLANTSDSTGHYVFSGFQSSTAPFTNNPAGGVNYLGDNGVRTIQVADTRQIATNDSGASVFLSVPAIGTSSVAAGSWRNTGTGAIAPPAITDPAAATNGHRYAITIGGTATAPTYSITDETTGNTTPAAAFTADSPIKLGGGLAVTLSGKPNPGDTFSVTPSTTPANGSLFSTIDSVIAALQTPAQNNTAAQASLANELSTGLTRFHNSLSAVTVVQASVGGREQELEALQSTTQNNSLQTQSDLSTVTGIDIVSAISKFELTQNSLQAAQQSFARIEGMSLFKYL